MKTFQFKPKVKKRSAHANTHENYEEIITKIFQNSKKTKLNMNEENKMTTSKEKSKNQVDTILITSIEFEKINDDKKYNTNSNILNLGEENIKYKDKSENLNSSKLSENITTSQIENKVCKYRHEQDENILNNSKNAVNVSKTFKDTKNNTYKNDSIKTKSINSIKELKNASEQNYNYDKNITTTSYKQNSKFLIISQKPSSNLLNNNNQLEFLESKSPNFSEITTEIIQPLKRNSIVSNNNTINEAMKHTNSAVKYRTNNSKIDKLEKFNDTIEKTPEIKKQNTKISKNCNSEVTKSNPQNVSNNNTIGKSSEKKTSIIGFLMNKHSKDFKSGSKNLNEKMTLETNSNSKNEISAKMYSTNVVQPTKKYSSNSAVQIDDSQTSSKIKSKIIVNTNILKKSIEINLNKRNTITTTEKNTNTIIKKNYTTNLTNSTNKKNSIINRHSTQKTFELNLNLESPNSKTVKNNFKTNAENLALNESNLSLNNSSNVINDIIKIKKSSNEEQSSTLDKSHSQKNVVFMSNLDTNNSSPTAHKPKNINKNFLVPTVRTNLYDENSQSVNEYSSNSLSENNSSSLLNNEKNFRKRNSERSESLKRRLSEARDKKLLEKQNSGMIETVNLISNNNFNKLNDELNEIRNNLTVRSKIFKENYIRDEFNYKSENYASYEGSNGICVLSPKSSNLSKNYFSNNSTNDEKNIVDKLRNRFRTESLDNNIIK